MGKARSTRFFWLVYALRPDGPKFYGLYYAQHAANAVARTIAGARVQQVAVVDQPESAVDISALIA